MFLKLGNLVKVSVGDISALLFQDLYLLKYLEITSHGVEEMKQNLVRC